MESRGEPRGGSRDDLFRLTDAGWIITLAFRAPVERVGHWGILQALNAEALMIADPYYGGRAIVSHSEFEWTTQFETPEQQGGMERCDETSPGAQSRPCSRRDEAVIRSPALTAPVGRVRASNLAHAVSGSARQGAVQG